MLRSIVTSASRLAVVGYLMQQIREALINACMSRRPPREYRNEFVIGFQSLTDDSQCLSESGIMIEPGHNAE